jgi:hypothetical protein
LNKELERHCTVAPIRSEAIMLEQIRGGSIACCTASSLRHDMSLATRLRLREHGPSGVAILDPPNGTEQFMRRLSYPLIGALLAGAWACVAPAAAQTSPDPDLTKRKCVIAHLPVLAAAVRAHMKAYRAANTGATQDEIVAERESFMKLTQSQHESEVAAATTACGIPPKS